MYYSFFLKIFAPTNLSFVRADRFSNMKDKQSNTTSFVKLAEGADRVSSVEKAKGDKYKKAS